MQTSKSPQLEDGHVRIANELFDAALAFPFTGRQLKVVMAIMRKTYGYGKKVDDVSASQLGNACGLSRTHVTTTMNQLAEMCVISKSPGRYGSIVGINKDYSKWKSASTESVQVSQIGTSTKTGQGVPKWDSASTESVQDDSTDSVHTKDNLPKDNQQKTCASADAFLRFWAAYPKKKSKVLAEKAFAKINPNEQLLVAMLAAVERAKTSRDWQKNDGQFIPYPASWLNARRWEDDSTGHQSLSAWWTDAGFGNPYEAENAGCTERTAYLWREGKRQEVMA